MAETILERLSAGGRLPTPPVVVVKLLDLTCTEHASVGDIARTIAEDPPLAAKLLRFANSPMAGISREVTSLERAVSLLGARGVKMMALSFAVLAPEDMPVCPGFDRAQFGIQSVGCGVAAKMVAEHAKIGAPQDAFAVGLLSQIGRSVFSMGMPDEYARVLAEARNIPDDLPKLEHAAFGVTYAAIGAQLLRSWGLPESLCGAIASLHAEPSTADETAMARVLRMAETAAYIICPSFGAAPPDADRFVRCLETYYSIPVDEGTALLSAIAAEIENVRVSLELPSGVMRSAQELQQEVRERVTELGLALQLENQALVTQQEDLMRRATTDSLTGIGNRAAFDARLALETERVARFGGPIALIMLDVDHFKTFNDTYGHQAGDRVLQAVARALDGNARKVDYVTRFGGEEFAVIAPDASLEGATALAERLRSAVGEITVPWNGDALRVTISAGVAVVVESSSDLDPTRLIAAADANLYEAKKAGRNQVSVSVLGERHDRPAAYIGLN